MFPKEIYIDRRNHLRKAIHKGIILILGNKECPMNYKANQYPFRQDSNFLYYFGIDEPDLAGIIDIEENTETIYGNDPDLEDIIWMGYQESMKEKCHKSGITGSRPWNDLKSDIDKAVGRNRMIYYLPPYRDDRRMQLSFLLGSDYDKTYARASQELIKEIAAQRSCKKEVEISEMEKTMNEVTKAFYVEAMHQIKPGRYEYEITGLIEGFTLERNCRMAYPIICSVNGHILHNHYHGNQMQSGDLLLIDAGAESPLHYATDLTRTFPVSGKYTDLQKDIYGIVLQAEVESIKAIKPGIRYLDIHLYASRIICQGLRDLGFMKGNVDNAVQAGAHALFFPHGLGHMIGLDVHDMEDLGEEFVGYDDDVKRINQFGTGYLRLGKKLKEGYTLTVEPGIYFIPALIEKWMSEKLHSTFIDYEKVKKNISFGGIRIEDNVLVTKAGHKIIGTPVPKTISEIENIMKR
ncbi:MAG: aminopeptidase P family protein [Bacteroidales bacterium]|nr:aminopeptidase P family protein [Bacteroidales bacterium]